MLPSSDIVAPVGAEHHTLHVAIEISRKSWVIGIKSPASERIGLHSLGAADVVCLKDLIEHQQTKAERALGREMRVLCCYEAGYEGFWLERTMSVETVVLDPANLLVNRKAKQRKTDRIDARKMVRALPAHDRGEAAVPSRVRIPSVEEEDRKRLLRERRRLVKERTSLTNAVKGLHTQAWPVRMVAGSHGRGAIRAAGQRTDISRLLWGWGRRNAVSDRSGRVGA